MKRFFMDTGIASDVIGRRRGVFERAQHEVSRGNPVGIGVSVLAELVYGIEQSDSRDRIMRVLRSGGRADARTAPSSSGDPGVGRYGPRGPGGHDRGRS